MSKKLALAEFFRNASTGHMALQLVERWGKSVTEGIYPIVAVQSKSVVLRRELGDSYLDLNYASLVDYDGETLLVYSVGKQGHRSRGPLMLKYKVHRI